MPPSNDLTCPECAAEGRAWTAKSPAGLGGHRMTLHGVPGKDRSSTRRRKYKGHPTKIYSYVQWLAAHPGPHNVAEIAEAVKDAPTQVGKTLSASKARGMPVDSDGRGNWEYVKEANLPAVVSNGHKPKPVEGQPPTLAEDAEIEIFSIRRAFLINTSEGLLIAEKLR